MFCNKCGNYISISAKYCNKCGNYISELKKQHTNNKEQGEERIRGTVDFNFKRYFKIIFIIIGLPLFFTFFISYLSEESLMSNIFYSLWALALMGIPLALLLTIIIKWSKEVYYKLSDKQINIQKTNKNNLVKKISNKVVYKKVFYVLGEAVILFVLILWVIGAAFIDRKSVV